MTDTVSINIPFEGFYDSIYSGEVDHIEEQEAEYMAERQAKEGIAPELRLEASEFQEFLFDCADYGKCYRAVAKEYAESFEELASDALDLKLGLVFEEMSSPREYNFTTDRLFCDAPLATVQELFKRSEAEGHDTLSRLIRKRFTSRDGFSSFYSNGLDDWLEKPLEDWDHNETGTLLLAALEAAGADADGDFRMSLYYATVENEGVWNAFQECVDWSKFEAKVEERRAELIEEQRELDPDYVAPPVRCPDTLDLFANL